MIVTGSVAPGAAVAGAVTTKCGFETVTEADVPVMAEFAPSLNLSVDNKLSDDGSKMRASLKFNHMDDFEPAKVAEQVPALKELLDMRKRLDEVLARISTNSQLEEMLQEVLSNTEKVQKLAKELGVDPNTPEEGK